MARNTNTTNPTAAAPTRRRRSPRRARLVPAAVMLAVLGTAGARAMAAPVGPIDVSGSGGSVAAAHVAYGIDAQGRVDRVTVQRDRAAPDQTVTVVVAGTAGPLATVTAGLHGPETAVALPAPVDPAHLTGVSLRPTAIDR